MIKRLRKRFIRIAMLSVTVVMVLLALAVLLAVYLIRCNGFRKRIRELDSEGTNYLGWSLSRLKETVAELEAKKVEENFEES